MLDGVFGIGQDAPVWPQVIGWYGDKIIMTMMPAGTDPPDYAAPAAWNAFKVITLPYIMPAGSSQLHASVRHACQVSTLHFRGFEVLNSMDIHV